MNDDSPHFALTCSDGDAPAPVLVGVQAQGRLDAVLFELTLRQTYRNTGTQVLEVVYTFPLPPTAVLLGFASELNGERQEGVIAAKRKAEQQYEASLQEGDAPVMLEAHDDGLHTANIGNLKPGDELVLECRFARLLSFEQGRLRVSIPTTIAPRFGHAEQACLQPQQVPLASLDAEYPLALTLTLGAALAGATAECPTHRFATRLGQDGAMHMELCPGARLDRDVVVIVTPREPRPSLLVRADNAFDASAPVVMMAALQPPAGTPRERIALKLLVDCSGSMNGDRIASARAALRGVVAGLSERDHLSLSRFGSTVEHLFAPSPAKPQALRHLQPFIDGIEADLGGTEMEGALKDVFDLPRSGEPGGADVLLITDGDIWQAKEMVAAARESGHRVFAIGVGTAPAEGVLRALAESTGGACEFATPGEALEAAAHRMLHRMRQPVFANIRIDWGSEPAWSCGPAASVFAGDTVIAFAGFGRPVQANAVRLLADDAQGNTVLLARGEADAPCPGDSLPGSLQHAASPMTPGPTLWSWRCSTSSCPSRPTASWFIDVPTRTRPRSRQRCTASARCLRQAGEASASSTSQRRATGRRLTSRSAQSGAPTGHALPRTASPSWPRTRRTFPPSCVRKAWHQAPATLAEMGRSVADHLDQGGSLQSVAQRCAGLTLHADALQAIEDVVNLGLSVDQAWLLLAHWVNVRASGQADAGLMTRLQPMLDAIDAALAAAATQLFERQLGAHANDEWRFRP